MKKFNLYALVLCSSLLCAGSAHATNEGMDGGRDALGADGSFGRSSSGMRIMERPPRPAAVQVLEDCTGGCEEPMEPSHSSSDSGSSDQEMSGVDTEVEDRPAMGQDTRTEERGANFSVISDTAKATGNTEHGMDSGTSAADKPKLTRGLLRPSSD